MVTLQRYADMYARDAQSLLPSSFFSISAIGPEAGMFGLPWRA